MLSRILRRLRRTRKAHPDLRQLLVTLKLLAEERVQLQRNLFEAIETITWLKAQLAEYDLLLAQAECRLPDFAAAELEVEQPPDHHPPGNHESQSDLTRRSGETWIDDLWLCSGKRPEALLEAESQWQDGFPELAMDIVSRTICTDPFLCPVEEMRCRVFVAAVLHCLGRYEESNKRLNVVLQMISRHYLFDGAHSKEITGIAHFLQGRNLMVLKEIPAAYWSLSRALCTPGYHVKAGHFQKQAIKDFTLQQAANKGDSLTTSLRPLLSSGSKSSSCSSSPGQSSTTSFGDGLDKSVEPGFNIREPDVPEANDRNIASQMYRTDSTMLQTLGDGRWF